MAVLRRAVNEAKTVVQLLFECPACGCYHAAWIKNEPGRPKWKWNGSMTAPTFSPSLKVTSRNEKGPTTCHFYVRKGKIQFLNDCTHELAGKTVDMVEDP